MNRELEQAVLSSYSSLDDLKLCIRKTKKINLKNNRGENALSTAVKKSLHNTVKFLASLPDINLEIKDRNDTTPLNASANLGDLEMMRLLINSGADINGTNFLGATVLMVCRASKECFREVLNHNPDLHIKTLQHMTIYTYFYAEESYESLKEIVRASKDLEDIKKFEEQHQSIYNYLIKKDSVNKKFNEQALSLLSSVRNNFELNEKLQDKPVKSLKHKI